MSRSVAGGRGLTAKGYKETFGDGNVLYLSCSGCSQLHMFVKTSNSTFKIGRFYCM